MSGMPNNGRVSAQTERRTTTTNDNGSARPRVPSGLGGSRDPQDPRRSHSPQTSTAGPTHGRTASHTQRAGGGVEERRTERTKITTRETMTSRTRSPDRRPAPSAAPTDRHKSMDAGKAQSKDAKLKPSKAESQPGTSNLCWILFMILRFQLSNKHISQFLGYLKLL